MRRTLVWMGVGLALLLIAGAAWLLLGDEPGSSKPRPTPSATQQVMPRQDVEYLENKLNSHNRKEQSLALIKDLRDNYRAQEEHILPSGAITLDPKFTKENGGIIVNARTSTQKSWVLHLVHEDDKWLILYTE